MTKSTGKIIKDPIKRFWTFTIANNSDDCWTWIGRKNYKGYGVMKINSHTIHAHRFSYELHVGKISKGMLVCHHCDNPACVNPAHLFVGTIQDNNKDRDRKGRTAIGENSSSAKLTEKDVIKIREFISMGLSDSEISRRFNVWATTIRNIRINHTWSHIQ